MRLVVIKETFARVIASRGKRPQCTGINICQRAHWVGFEEISGALSCHTCGEETQEPSDGRNWVRTWKFSRWSPRSTIVQWSERKGSYTP
ncbi:hypothetical protein AVEN_189661-1 [Araneus ventricosus]|uniref:Uncharacterized protein n=1 Tax=Araneus ventricosus TaxID=182803 RepID=A0A4Y2M2M7_ARAVE|nr:hypothetical protein AVEN_189661-1 [Araneus ventricosus]